MSDGSEAPTMPIRRMGKTLTAPLNTLGESAHITFPQPFTRQDVARVRKWLDMCIDPLFEESPDAP